MKSSISHHHHPKHDFEDIRSSNPPNERFYAVALTQQCTCKGIRLTGSLSLEEFHRPGGHTPLTENVQLLPDYRGMNM